MRPKSMDELRKDKLSKDFLKAKSKYCHYKKLGHVWGTERYRKEMVSLEKQSGNKRR